MWGIRNYCISVFKIIRTAMIQTDPINIHFFHEMLEPDKYEFLPAARTP